MPLQTGRWIMNLNGRVMSLAIDSVNQGEVKGSVDNLDFDKAFWDEDAQKLMVVITNRKLPTQDPPRVFVGYLFTDPVNFTGVRGSIFFTLTGYVEHFGESTSVPITPRKSVLGWYAQTGVE
jgi:hypothetical protein